MARHLYLLLYRNVSSKETYKHLTITTDEKLGIDAILSLMFHQEMNYWEFIEEYDSFGPYHIDLPAYVDSPSDSFNDHSSCEDDTYEEDM